MSGGTVVKKSRKIAFLFLASLAVLYACASAEAKPTLAVKTFENKTDEKSFEPPADAITDMMTTELYEAGLFRLVERDRLDVIGEELKLSQSGLMDMETAPEVGKIVGAKYQMIGAITGYYYNASGGAIVIPWIAGGAAASKTAYAKLDIRIVDSSTGEVIYAGATQGSAKREAGGILTVFGGFGSVQYGGILATAVRDSVEKHVAAMKTKHFEE
ncbi:MAG: CsgG/HfaB family protein [Synergistaceae bacterium]|jgi:curli biogenesis system outer membrane secretion channel CsgG|nr:CsgG/HfaB family protein [Synergistaceae bacterium]